MQWQINGLNYLGGVDCRKPHLSKENTNEAD